jgi:Uma2 family endonuclease
MSMTALPKHRMKVPEFLAWANEQLDSNYELVDGEVVAMAPERLRHILVKAAVYRVLDDAVKAAGLPCTVFPDGAGVVINDNTTRIPDASVQCGVKLNLESMVLEAPLIVVEVVSPSSERQDLGAKLVEYFSVPSIRHYLVVVPEKRAVVHHMRNAEGALSTYIGRNGDIVLNPPGIKVPVTGLVGPLFDEEAEAGQ